MHFFRALADVEKSRFCVTLNDFLLLIKQNKKIVEKLLFLQEREREQLKPVFRCEEVGYIQ